MQHYQQINLGLNMKEYIEGLQKILERIEVAKKEENQKAIAEWFIYLQGYIKASKVIDFKK